MTSKPTEEIITIKAKSMYYLHNPFAASDEKPLTQESKYSWLSQIITDTIQKVRLFIGGRHIYITDSTTDCFINFNALLYHDVAIINDNDHDIICCFKYNNEKQNEWDGFVGKNKFRHLGGIAGFPTE